MKNNILRVTLVAVFALSLCSCHKTVMRSEYSFSSVEKAKMSDIVRDYSVVCLETVVDNLILDPTVVEFSADRIFILDRFSPSKSLYVFRKDGKYVGKVGSKGEGPGEYIMPHSFVVNEKHGRIFLRDMAANKVLAYNLETLEFVEDYPLPFYATCFEKLGDDCFIWYVNAGLQNQGDFLKHLQITDTKCTPLFSAVEQLAFPERGIYNVRSYFSVLGEETYFHHPFMGDYFRCAVEDSVLQPAFSLCFSELPFPSQDYIIKHKDNIVKDLEADHYIQWCDALKNSTTCLCYLGTGKTIYWGVFNENESKGWYVDQNQLIDDLGIGKLTRPKTVYQDYFVSFISTENMNLDELPDNSILKPYLNADNMGGNPIMLLYK